MLIVNLAVLESGLVEVLDIALLVGKASTPQLPVLIARQRVNNAMQAKHQILGEQQVVLIVNLAVLESGLLRVLALALLVGKAGTRQRTRLRVLIRVKCAQQAKHQIR